MVLLLFASTATPVRAQTLTTLVNFTGTNGAPSGPLVQGTDGNLYGAIGGRADGAGSIFKATWRAH